MKKSSVEIGHWQSLAEVKKDTLTNIEGSDNSVPYKLLSTCYKMQYFRKKLYIESKRVRQ